MNELVEAPQIIPGVSLSTPSRRRSLSWAAGCALLVLLWQIATVHYNYGGNWSALFCTGDLAPVPPSLSGEQIYRFPGSNGWDGQFYHYIAHDPLLRDGLAQYIDAPRLRYRRILIPATAFLLAAGRAEYIDAAYRTVVLLFFLLGAYCLSRLAVLNGRSAAWGMVFFFTPAAVVSTDRMAVDVSLAALVLAFVLLTRTHRFDRTLYAVLALAALTRDTGILLAGAYCMWLLTEKRYRHALLAATAGIPALLWYAYVVQRTEPYPQNGRLWAPFTGLLDRFVHPAYYPFDPALNLLLQGLDFLAAAGILAAILVALFSLRRQRMAPSGFAIVLFVTLALLVWRPGDWLEAFDYGRILSPLLILLALDSFESLEWITLAPICMVIPRFGMQMISQVTGVIKGVLGLG